MNSKGGMKMKSMELLNETMEELNLSEQMSINGGGINASMVWYNLYGAFAKHGCAYPVGFLETAKYIPKSGVCTSR